MGTTSFCSLLCLCAARLCKRFWRRTAPWVSPESSCYRSTHPHTPWSHLSVCRWPKKLAEQVPPGRPQLPGGGQLCVGAHRPLLRMTPTAVMLLNVEGWKWRRWNWHVKKKKKPLVVHAPQLQRKHPGETDEEQPVFTAPMDEDCHLWHKVVSSSSAVWRFDMRWRLWRMLPVKG